MSVAKVVQGYFAQRVVLTSPKPFSKVLAALDAEVNKENPHVKQILNGSKSKEEIEQGVGALTDSGKRNSIYVAPELSSAAPLTNTRDSRLFAADFYSRWLSVYYGKKLPDLALYTFGNPLFAKELMTRDLATGLGLPPRVLVQGTPEGGTKIQYDLPSAWFTGKPPSPELEAALEGLDGKLEATVRKVLS